MPRPVRFKTAAVGELLKQVRYASADVRLKQLRAAETLAREIDPERTYPEEFIIYRVTGYRPRSADAMLVGAALVGDLAQLVTELSKRLSIKSDATRPALTVDALAARWGVSLKSLSRYRHRGLICQMLMMDGEHRMACYEDEAARFAAAHPEMLRKASAFDRMDEATVRQIVEQARELRERSGATLNRAARELAKAHGRSLEAVRGVLQRHDAQRAAPVFVEPGPLTEQQRRVIHRAWRLGVKPRAIARRFGKSMQTIHRVIGAQRLVQLRSERLAYMNMPTFERGDAADVILSPASVRTGLGDDERFHDAFTLLQACRSTKRGDADAERQRLAAYNWLKRCAGDGVQTEETPTAESLDVIETQLRWASRLKRRLVETALPSAVRTIEQALHRPIAELPSGHVLELIGRAVGTCAQTVDAFDPVRGRGVERAVALAMGRAMARLSMPDRTGRAAARHAGESLATAGLFDALNPWQVWLDVPWRMRAKLDVLKPESRQVVEQVMGLGDAAPVTVSQAAVALGLTRAHVARLLREALIALRREAAV